MRIILTILSIFVCFTVSAKQTDSVIVNKKDKNLSTLNSPLSTPKSQYPVIGMWKQNYMVTGFATNRPVSQYSSDVKFQLSLALRLWNINGKVDFLATYSQRSVWDIYQKSCPFRETAYNPGFWVAWQTSEKVRLLFAIEHESNGIGLESGQSRSFNYATVACLYEPTDHWRLGARAWYGYFFHDEDINQKYFCYRGVMQLWGTFHTLDDRFSVTALVNPTVTFTRYNVQLEASWRMAKRGDWLPCLFVQYNYGYGETMIDYDKLHSKIRIGISLMNNRLNLY